MTAPYIPPDPHAVAIRRALASLSMPNVMPDMTRVASQAPPVQQQPTIGAAPAAPQYAQPVGGVLGALLSAGQSTDRMLHNFRDHPMQSLANLTGVPQVAQGIREGSPGSIAGGLLAAAAPFLGFPEERLASEAAGVGASDAMRNMAATGFAFPKSGAMVELPAGGAGRVGSTATAMAHALRTTSPDNFRQLVLDEIARRGGASSPEVEMAATEEVARHLASRRGLLPAAPPAHAFADAIPDHEWMLMNRYVADGSQASATKAADAFAMSPAMPEFQAKLRHTLGHEFTVYRAGPLKSGEYQSFTTDPARAAYFGRLAKSGAPKAYRVRAADVAFPGADADGELVIKGNRVAPTRDGGD